MAIKSVSINFPTIFGALVRATFLQQDPFQERILVSQHKTFVGSTPMGSLQIMNFGFLDSNFFLELLDVLCPALSESCLGLTIALLAFLGSSI
jgi:hypothetical protein